MPREKTIDQLNRIYDKAEDVDREIFAEMRSNILLVSGEHYSRVNSRVANNIRTSSPRSVNSGTNEQKLRLTKNHMHRTSRAYVTAILSEAPDTTISPQRPTELQDKKDAELNQAVWLDAKNRHKLHEKKAEYCKNFIDIGEVCLKIFWNPNAGRFKGYAPKVDEETGEPVMEDTGETQPSMDPATGQPQMDEQGQPVMQAVQRQAQDEERPMFTGDYEYEQVFGFNLLREAAAQEMYEHGRCWIVRKMVGTDELKRSVPPDVRAKISSSKQETFVVFDANKATYDKVKDQTLVREYYWPVCEEYPEGWYEYSTKDVKISSGPLPGGIWPLIWSGFDKYATTPRGRSILKVARPYQAEINRASSQMAVAQITLGDDKVLYQAGTKLAPGALLPGVRGISYQGSQPSVLPGRNGAQYLDYVSAQIVELDKAVMNEGEDDANSSGQIEPYALLFRAASRKRRYSPYIEKFENFWIRVTETTLAVAKFYLPDEMLIPAVGTREQVNIQEFRSTTPLNYQIIVEAQADTLETKFGRQLSFQHILQYVGKDLDKSTIGKVIKNLPFGNFEDSFDDLTLDEDIATDDMLALERGQQVQASKYTDPVYMLKKLTSRMKKPEFQFLSAQIQQNYQALEQQYEQINVANEQKLLAAKNEYIPVDGTLVTVDMYVPDPKNPDNQAKRAKLPERALEWLIKALEQQGMSMDKMEGMNATAMADMATQLLNKQQMQQQQRGPQPPPGMMPGRGSMPMAG